MRVGASRHVPRAPPRLGDQVGQEVNPFFQTRDRDLLRRRIPGAHRGIERERRRRDGDPVGAREARGRRERTAAGVDHPVHGGTGHGVVERVTGAQSDFSSSSVAMPATLNDSQSADCSSGVSMRLSGS